MQERLRYLFRQYLENRCSRKELEEFFSYIRKAENNEALRQQIREVYYDIRKTTATQASVDENGQLVFHEPEWLRQPAKPAQPQKKRTLALLLLLVAGMATAVWLMDRPVRSQATLSSVTKKATDRSELKFILLKDSTQVWLNAASSLEFPDQFDKNKREVYLSGEAYFDVKHADKLPFIIHTGTIATTVLGTSFNIKAYPGQKNIIVSVSRGKVKLSRDNRLIVTLEKGQQAKVEEKGDLVTEKKIPEEEVAGWQHGTLVYDEETLKDIIGDMERIYNVRVSIQDASIGGLNISTSFKREIGIEQALQVLCKLTDTELKRTAEGYMIQ